MLSSFLMGATLVGSTHVDNVAWTQQTCGTCARSNVVDMVVVILWGNGAPAFGDTASTTLELELADGAAVSKVHAEILDHATVIVDENSLASIFIAFAAFGARFVFTIDGVEVGVDSIDFTTEDVEFCLGEQVEVAVGAILRLVTLHLCIATVDPLAAVLGRGTNDGTSNEVRAALGLAARFGRAQVGVLGLVMGLLSSRRRGCMVSQVRGLLASLRTTTILLLEAEVLRERVGGFALGVDASGATVACCSTRGALRR
jgi:hypothetical protein